MYVIDNGIAFCEILLYALLYCETYDRNWYVCLQNLALCPHPSSPLANRSKTKIKNSKFPWLYGVVVIITAKIHSAMLKLMRRLEILLVGVLEICDEWNLWQWSQLEIRLSTFNLSTTLQKQFIITMISDGFNSPMNIACKVFLWSLFLVSSQIFWWFSNYL